MKLLLTGAFQYSEKQLDQIKCLGYEIIFIQEERTDLCIDVTEIEAVVCNNLFLYNDIKELTNLKFIQLTCVGLERVPMDYIKFQKIQIHNAGGVYSVPIAEWVILKVLEFYKKSSFFYENQREKIWKKNRQILELKGKTASVIGFGSNGKEIAKRLAAFDVNIIAVDVRRVECEYIREYLTIDSLKQVLSRSDLVILALPLTDETYHIIDEEELKCMKDDAVIINNARGSIINEKALIKEVEKGRFLGVGLDVFEDEPIIKTSKLWEFKNVSITPHNSFVSEKNDARLFELIVKNLSNLIEESVN